MKHNEKYDCPKCPACKRNAAGVLECVNHHCPFKLVDVMEIPPDLEVD